MRVGVSLREVGFDETAGQLLRIPVELLEPEELALEVVADPGVGRVGVNVTELPRISLEVIKLPGIDDGVEVDELVPLGADAVMALDHVNGREFVIMVENRLGPPGYRPGLRPRQKTPPLHGGRLFQ